MPPPELRGIVAFAGPSLPPEAARRWPGIDFRPPATAGDALALLPAPPAILALIDGRFDAVAAIGHKELLALAVAGTHVVGAASMGALRAAELHALGMTGIGRVYRAYRAGRLTGDDEVALVHAPAALGWRPLTVAMVDLRAGLRAGCRHGLWSPAAAARARAALHATHFADRDPAAVARVMAAFGLNGDALLALLAAPGIAPKRADAALCLDLCAAAALPARGVAASPPATSFLRAQAAARGVTLPSTAPASPARRP